jgi:vacuolar-type H+-ATPase subunit H
MANQGSSAGLSPLDQIRLTEAEMARKIATTREAAEHARIEARSQAALLREQAREAGLRKGQICYNEIAAGAEQEARAIVESAHSQAAELQRKGQACMDVAIQEVTNIVLGLKEGGKPNEP